MLLCVSCTQTFYLLLEIYCSVIVSLLRRSCVCRRCERKETQSLWSWLLQQTGESFQRLGSLASSWLSIVNTWESLGEKDCSSEKRLSMSESQSLSLSSRLSISGSG